MAIDVILKSGRIIDPSQLSTPLRTSALAMAKSPGSAHISLRTLQRRCSMCRATSSRRV